MYNEKKKSSHTAMELPGNHFNEDKERFSAQCGSSMSSLKLLQCADISFHRNLLRDQPVFIKESTESRLPISSYYSPVRPHRCKGPPVVRQDFETCRTSSSISFYRTAALAGVGLCGCAWPTVPCLLCCCA